MSQSSFSSLPLNQALLDNLESLGYHNMTPIQAQSLPPIIAGRDLIAQGKTGSGKTAAFGIGLLHKLKVKAFRIQSLVLCPTRELADQVARELRSLARTTHNIKILTVCGGMPFGPQINSIEHGAHIVVGTPGRIEEHLRKGTLSFEHVNTLVLDEADRMLDMGFEESLDAILAQVPSDRQTLLFSATYPDQIQAMAERVMQEPEIVRLTETHDEQSISQRFYRLGEDAERSEAVRLLLLEQRPDSALVFCNTKRETQELANHLQRKGFSALALHGDMEQKDRDRTLVLFSSHCASVLVATDVAARGLDIESLDLVINYQLARDPEVHLHRIGRTGRAGSRGMACTLFTEREAHKIERLEKYLGQSAEPSSLPSSSLLSQPAYKAPMVCLQIGAGKKQKLRPGDILGALTSGQELDGKQVGKIHVADNSAYVAVSRKVADLALEKLGEGKLKGRSFRVRAIEN